MTPTQRSTVHVADRAAPNDADRWRPIEAGKHALWLYNYSIGYLWQKDNGGGIWPGEESDLGALSERFPGVLFVSASECTSERDGPARWRFFALNGEAWRVIETDGVWAHPLLSGLGPSHFGAVADGMSPSGATPAGAPVRSGAETSQSAAGRLGTSGETEP